MVLKMKLLSKSILSLSSWFTELFLRKLPGALFWSESGPRFEKLGKEDSVKEPLGCPPGFERWLLRVLMLLTFLTRFFARNCGPASVRGAPFCEPPSGWWKDCRLRTSMPFLLT